MGIHVIKMPDIGEGIAEVELVAWRVQPGDTVAEDQILADVMTDKATVEFPSPVVGKVLALGGAVGQVMAVGGELIRIEVAGAGNASATSAVAAAPVPLPAASAAPPVVSPAPAAAVSVVPPSTPAPVQARAASTSVAPPIRRPGDKPIASPAVRRRAWELGVELQNVPGSGMAGRIMHADLDAFVARAGSQPPDTGAGASAIRYAQRNDEEAIPIIGLRRKIARKMQEAKRRIPHFTYVEEIDVTELEALRQRLNARWGTERVRLTVLPLLIRAVVLAVREFPQVNARFDDDAGVVTRYGAVHVGIATQTEAGLMVPVLRHAEGHDLWTSAAEVARLAEAARAGKVTRGELTGSTITITSLGALGGIVSTPVINHPEVAIVGVNRMVERPMMRGAAIVPRLMMNLSSSFDHRVVDGLHAAEFIQVLRGLLECPATLFVE
ncbi:MAG: dihydrolipoamide acetyltransferase family protein [Rhodoferax sp.]|nr:dihydrolipoamide acetyltransferase family protein [Rhodoferax sp.]